MNRLKETLTNQQRINKAVESCIDYFGVNDDYVEHLERMLNAQMQILGMVELVKQKLEHDDKNKLLFCQSEEVIYFLYDVQAYLSLLKPFAEMAGAIGGEGENYE